MRLGRSWGPGGLDRSLHLLVSAPGGLESWPRRLDSAPGGLERSLHLLVSAPGGPSVGRAFPKFCLV